MLNFVIKNVSCFSDFFCRKKWTSFFVSCFSDFFCHKIMFKIYLDTSLYNDYII
jgi:hypothetical protein